MTIIAMMMQRKGGRPRTLPVRVFLTLATLAGFAPLGIDMYLPSLTQIATDLAARPSSVQLTLTAFLLGVAAGQIVIGPVSDGRGRRGPLLASLALCAVATIVCALAPSVWVLVAGRFVQGLGGSGGIVLARATISDLTTGDERARYFSLLAAIGGLAPIVAPLIGGVILLQLGWRWVFGVLAVLVGLMLLAAGTVLAESLPVERRIDSTVLQTWATMRRVCSDRLYLAHALTFALCFAALIAYISASPFIFGAALGLSTMQYTVVFSVNALGIVLVSLLNARLLGRHSPRQLLRCGYAVMLVCGILLLVLVVTGRASLPALLGPVFLIVASVGFIMGNASALAITQTPYALGTGAAVLGALQSIFGAITSPLVGLGGEHAVGPLGAVVVVCAGTALLIQVAADRAPPTSH